MEQSFFNSNAMLIQGVTMNDLESMISHLLDKKLANIEKSTPKVEERPRDGLNKREAAAKKLQISTTTLDSWAKRGIIKPRRIGTRIYYTDSDIANALEKIYKL